MQLSLINAHGGMQCSAMPKGRSFAQTLPRGLVLGFIEGSGNQTRYEATHFNVLYMNYVLFYRKSSVVTENSGSTDEHGSDQRGTSRARHL